MMDWAECMNYCWHTLSAKLGQSFIFADILDADSKECLRHNMKNQYSLGNGYATITW